MGAAPTAKFQAANQPTAYIVPEITSAVIFRSHSIKSQNCPHLVVSLPSHLMLYQPPLQHLTFFRMGPSALDYSLSSLALRPSAVAASFSCARIPLLAEPSRKEASFAHLDWLELRGPP
jgi:hypothetical protein